MNKFRTVDWIWLMTFLLYAQVFSFLYKDNVMQVISYVSTFVSIALGAVAMYTSIREATRSDHVKDEIFDALTEMRVKINQLDTKIDSFNPNKFNSEKNNEIDQTASSFQTEIAEELQQKFNNGSTLTKDEVISIFNQKISEMAEELKENTNVPEDTILNEYTKLNFVFPVPKKKDGLFLIVLNSYEIGEEFTLDSFYRKMKNHGTVYARSYILQRLGNLKNLGYLERNNKGNFIRIK